MQFINREILWLLPAVLPLLLLCWIYGDWRRRVALKRFVNGGAEQVIARHRRILRRTILFSVAAMLIVAAARPYWGERPLEVNISETDALVIFDVSKSMLAQDVAPSRLEHGKWLIKELIQKNKNTNFGLVAFAGRAFPSCPLTNDRVSLEQCIDELNCDLIPTGGTNLAAALEMAIKLLKAAGTAQRDIILITDGEELSGSAARELETLKALGIRLLVIGLGDPSVGALIPESDRGNQVRFKRDRNGELVQSKLNEALLKRIADETGGWYINSTPARTGIRELSDLIQQNNTQDERSIKQSLPVERFMIFLLLAAVGLVIYMLLGEGRKHKTALTVCILGVYFFCGNILLADEENTQDPPENTGVVAGSEITGDYYTLYNRARALQLAGNIDEALQIYSRLNVPEAPEDVRLAALHNSGVAQHSKIATFMEQAKDHVAAGKLDEALQTITGAEQLLESADELYLNVLAQAASGKIEELTSEALQQLLLDRKILEELRKVIEELKKLQQQARQQLENAQQQQEQNQQGGEQNQQDNPQDNQQNSEQNQQGGEQNQQGNQQGNQQNSTQNQQGSEQNQQGGLQGQNGGSTAESLQAAGETLDKLTEASRGVSPALEEQSQEAAEAVQTAGEKLAAGDEQGASEAIRQALENLGNKNSETESTSEQTATGEAAENSAPESGGEEKTDLSGAAGQRESSEANGNPADTLLDVMAQDEKLLRDAIMNNRKNRIVPVEKDW